MDSDFERYRRGNPFDLPQSPDELEMMVGWFFDRIRKIVVIENHHHKFDGIDQCLDIIEEAKKVANINVDIAYIDGIWYLVGANSRQDILRLPELAKTFGKIYRHRALEYSKGENETLLIDSEHLDTVEAKKVRDMV